MTCRRKKENEKVKEIVKGIIEEGGEGVILQKMKSLYEHGRTSSLIKLKVFLLLLSLFPFLLFLSISLFFICLFQVCLLLLIDFNRLPKVIRKQ